MHVITVYTDACHNCIYNRFPENEPSVSKYIEDIKKNKNSNINLGNVHIIGLYCTMSCKISF
jgi:hypothetical protein